MAKKRIATISIGPRTATFDGERWESASKSLARLLNQEMRSYHAGAPLNIAPRYRPDAVNDFAADIAAFYGGKVIKAAPPIDYSNIPADAVF